MKKKSMKSLRISEEQIKESIYTIRGMQVMVDSDLARLYTVSVKALNQAVKRNKERFPQEFMFQLTQKEYDALNESKESFQKRTLEKEELRSQIVTSKVKHGGRRYLPHVFTEPGIAMLSSVLRNHTAVKVSIHIMNAFVAMRKFIAKNAELFYRMDSMERKQLAFEVKTDKKFEDVFNALQVKKPEKGVFFDGQIFDAYQFVADLIRTALTSIIIVDNYIDDSVLLKGGGKLPPP